MVGTEIKKIAKKNEKGKKKRIEKAMIL